jgi:uncharacterized membrane protein
MTVISKLKRAVPIWLCVLIFLYSVAFGWLSVFKHDTFHSFTYDLGIMLQVTWNTSQGRPFEVSLDRPYDTNLIGSYNGNHVRPIFVPLFWVARRELRSQVLQVVVVICYLLYPALGFISLFDFHPEAFCVPALLLAYWALLERHDVPFWSMIVLTLSTKEELVVPVAAFGIYCLFRPEWRRKGMWMLAISILWAVLCFFVIIPYANEGRPYRFFELWSHLLPGGDGGGEETGSLASLLSIDAVYFVAHLLVPLGFICLLEPGLMGVSLPSLAYLLVSNRANLYRVGHQYPAVLIPWLFLATVYGLAKLEQWPRLRPWAKRWLPLTLLLVGTLGAQLKFNPISVTYWSGYLIRMPYDSQVREAMAQIPPDAGVATINALGPHLANRRYLIGIDKYSLPLNQDHLQYVDYVLLDLVDCRFTSKDGARTHYTQVVRAVIDSGDFGVRYWSGRILLLERGAPPGPELDEVRVYVDQLEEEGRPCWP